MRLIEQLVLANQQPHTLTSLNVEGTEGQHAEFTQVASLHRAFFPLQLEDHQIFSKVRDEEQAKHHDTIMEL